MLPEEIQKMEQQLKHDYSKKLKKGLNVQLLPKSKRGKKKSQAKLINKIQEIVEEEDVES